MRPRIIVSSAHKNFPPPAACPPLPHHALLSHAPPAFPARVSAHPATSHQPHPCPSPACLPCLASRRAFRRCPSLSLTLPRSPCPAELPLSNRRARPSNAPAHVAGGIVHPHIPQHAGCHSTLTQSPCIFHALQPSYQTLVHSFQSLQPTYQTLQHSTQHSAKGQQAASLGQGSRLRRESSTIPRCQFIEVHKCEKSNCPHTSCRYHMFANHSHMPVLSTKITFFNLSRLFVHYIAVYLQRPFRRNAHRDYSR